MNKLKREARGSQYFRMPVSHNAYGQCVSYSSGSWKKVRLSLWVSIPTFAKSVKAFISLRFKPY